MKAFKAYDIRGIYNSDFNKDDVYKIGYFIPRLLNCRKVLVGQDARISSDEIFNFLTKGITDAGADVYNVGLATTPMVYWSTAKYGFEASVQITASHNSKEYNGLKISRREALPVGYDSGLKDLEYLINNDKVIPNAVIGRIRNFSVTKDYLAFLLSFKKDISNLSFAIDCSNGMAGLLVHQIFNNQPDYLYDTLDGTFPNHEANPLIEKNLKDLKEKVKLSGCDLGIIYDGDADRVCFVDEKGQFVSPDLIIALLGHHFLKKEKGWVIQDIRSSKSVNEYINKLGSKVYTWRVGRAYAALKLREIKGIYGGELAGHYYFRDFYYSDSGFLASILVLNILSDFKKKGISFSKIIEEISSYESTGEVNFRIEKKEEAMEAVKNHFTARETPVNIMDFDGYRIEFNDWWFNIRPSNTEPYLRFIAEARSRQLLDQNMEVVRGILKGFG